MCFNYNFRFQTYVNQVERCKIYCSVFIYTCRDQTAKLHIFYPNENKQNLPVESFYPIGDLNLQLFNWLMQPQKLLFCDS